MRRITNRSNLFAIIIVSLLCITVSSCAIEKATEPDKSITQIQAGESWQTIKSGPTDRRYLLYVPAAYDGNTPVPLVLNFHGSGAIPLPSWHTRISGSWLKTRGLLSHFPWDSTITAV